MSRMWIAAAALAVGIAVLVTLPTAGTAVSKGDSYGLVDPDTGIWHLYEGGTEVGYFYFGNPGDYPFMGDWNCDDIDTPGLYRQSDGYVYLRNSNTQGVADISFYFGNPGDVPIAGDFNADGCDTVSIYRPSNQTFYIINKLGTNDGGLGAADYSYVFGNPGDKPFIGDFNGNGQDTAGLHRESTGLVYYRNTNTQGNADNTFIYGDPGDRFVAGDWTGNGVDSPGVYRPSNTTMYLRYENSQGNADAAWNVGMSSWLPVAGIFGDKLPPPPTTTTTTTTTKPPPPGGFGDGLWIVGQDIAAGTYRTGSSPDSCYGARLSGFGGTLDDIIANEISDHPIIVTIEPSDAGFESNRCGWWSTDLSPQTSSPTAGFTDGYWLVGTEVAPGLWRNTDSSETCYWARLSGFSWQLKDIIANGISDSIQTVRISSGDQGFSSSRCGNWTYLGP